MSLMPRYLITPELVEFSLKLNPHNLGGVPRDMITQEMVNYVLGESWETITSIPIEFLTKKMVIDIINNHPGAIRRLSDQIKAIFDIE